MKNDVRTLLNRLIELLQPNNFLVEDIKKADAEAAEVIEVTTKENENYDLDLKSLNKNKEDVISFKDAITPIYKDYINVVDANKIPIDLPCITQTCKSIVEDTDAQIKDISKKITENEEKKSQAELVVNETPIKLQEEEDARTAALDLINTILEDPSDITQSRVVGAIKALKVFDEEEINNMLPIICFPNNNYNGISFENVYKSFNDNKGKSTRDVLKEAMKESNEEENLNPEERMDEILKVVGSEKKLNKSTLKTEKVEKEVKEEKKVTKEKKINVDPKLEFLKSELGVTDLDISFNKEILEVSQNNLEKMVAEAKKANINPKSISLRNYCGDFKQFINNIKELPSVDDQTVLKNPILGAISTERLKNNMKLIEFNGLSIVKPNGKLAIDVLGRDTKKLSKAISLIGQIDFEYFLKHPENMGQIIGGVAVRILYCQQNGINYKDAYGNFESFIYNEKEFEDLYGKVGKEIIPSAKTLNEKLLETVEDKSLIKSLNDFHKTGNVEKISLDHAALEKFVELSETVKSIDESEKPYETIIDGDRFYTVDFQKNLSHLLSVKPDANNDELILTSLMFNTHKDPEVIKKVQHQLNPNTRNMELAA